MFILLLSSQCCFFLCFVARKIKYFILMVLSYLCHAIKVRVDQVKMEKKEKAIAARAWFVW